MTISCDDCRDIPKVQSAGARISKQGANWQVMFNGLEVAYGGYYGEWMAEIICRLQGHHEPQEELVFHRVLERLGPGSTMIELGCFWAFYSLWFTRSISQSRVVLAEPDPTHLELAKVNFSHNGLTEFATFSQACAGFDRQYSIHLESEDEIQSVQGKSVATLMDENDLEYLDILHADVQGAECDVLESIYDDNLADKIRFVFVSTHHHLISGDPLTHERCLHQLSSMGAHIICEHTVEESFSGDGLIVASLNDSDEGFVVPVSRNRASSSLFRPLGYDLADCYR
ncbi:MAG: FkbM family methyltransferase [Halioglobus sp.]